MSCVSKCKIDKLIQGRSIRTVSHPAVHRCAGALPSECIPQEALVQHVLQPRPQLACGLLDHACSQTAQRHATECKKAQPETAGIPMATGWQNFNDTGSKFPSISAWHSVLSIKTALDCIKRRANLVRSRPSRSRWVAPCACQERSHRQRNCRI